MLRGKISGTGSYLPEKILTNADLEKIVDTSDEWITTRTGIKERHVAAPDERTSDMAYKAAKQALESAKMSPEEIDCILVATVTPDMSFPSTACILQEKLETQNCMAMDLSAACSGFIYGLHIANSLIATKEIKNALVIGAEILTSISGLYRQEHLHFIRRCGWRCCINAFRNFPGDFMTLLSARRIKSRAA